MRSIRGTPPLFLLAVALIVVMPGAGAADDFRATGGEIIELVRGRFFNRARAEAWAGDHLRYAQDIRDPLAFVQATRTALGRLEASHTGFYTPDDPEYFGLLSIFRTPLKLQTVEVDSIGLDLAPGNFARTVFAGSPAEKAGIRRGDQVLTADGEAFHPIRSLRGRSGGAMVALSIRSRRDDPPREVVVRPRLIEPKREWLEAQSAGARVFDSGGKRVAYMPMFSAAGDEHLDVLRAEVVGAFAEADALILDFRDGWGGANPTFLNLFGKAAPVLEMVGPEGVGSRYDPQWRKPLFILINGGSRSGKEVVAFAVQKHKLGTLVGEKTAGAVLAGSPFLLGDRTLLWLAVADVRVDGERLEGRGVAPDVEVADPLPFAEGRDPQLAKALELAGS